MSHHATWSKNKAAIRYLGTETTYSELESQVARLAATLVIDLNVTPGDRVAFLGLNSPELLKLIFACARAGALFVPLNARMTVEQHKVFIDDFEPSLMIAESEFGLHARKCLQDTTSTRLMLLGPDESDSELPHGFDYLKVGTAELKWNGDNPSSNPVMLAYTSGTTGTPKAAVHTNESFMAGAANSCLIYELNSATEILTNAPLFHIGGMAIQTLPTLYVGGSVTIHREIDTALVLNDIARYGVTRLMAPPVLSFALFNDPNWKSADLSSLIGVGTGSTRVPIEVIDGWLDRGVPIIQTYGMTEAIPPILSVPLDQAHTKKDSIGIPTPFCEVRIVDEEMNDVQAGQSGEMVLRGPVVIKEYWNNSGATGNAFNDGWFHTGDAAHQDDDGYFYMDDRIKEIIIVGSSNVYPADLERVLDGYEPIAECSVISREDDEFGEVPVVFIVAKVGHQIDRSTVMGLFAENLATYQHPHEIIFVDDLPRTALGKVNKSELRNKLSSARRS
jgi:fatty-acyl-CoA synthase